MDIRKSSRYVGILTNRFSVDSTSTVKSDRKSRKTVENNKKKSNLFNTALDYGDDDALIESDIWSNIKVMFWDFIPDYTPLNFILIQLFAFMVFLSFRSITFPKYIPPERVEEDVQIQYEYTSYIKDYFNSDDKQFDLIINTLKLLFMLLTINIFVLFMILVIRFVCMKFLFELFSRISRSAVLIAYSVDPGVFYLICSLVNYTVFLRCLIESGITSEYKTYKFQLFGKLIPKDFWIDRKCYSWCKSLYHLHILFAVRKLILSTLVFLFELQFLANYSSDLTTYLNELSCLRKFTLKWLNYVYHKKSTKIRELDELMDKFLDIDMSVVKKSYNTIWLQHRKDDFRIFKPILCKWQYHNIKNDLDLHDYNGTDFLKDLWISSMSIKPSVNWIVLNYVIHNPPEILLLHNSIQLICKDTVDYYSKFLFDQIYCSLTILRSKEHRKFVSVRPSVPKIEAEKVSNGGNEDYVEDEKDAFYQHAEKDADNQVDRKYDKSVSGVYDRESVMGYGNQLNRISQLGTVKQLDDMFITRDFEPARARKYNLRQSQVTPELMKYRRTILDPNISASICVDALMSNCEMLETEEEEEDDRYITKEMCADLDQNIVEDFFLSYDISNCSAISCDNFVMAMINMCSIRKKLITTLKNQRSILELVGKLISIILWFMSFVALLLSFRINKNIVLPSTIGLFSATIVALSYMYTSFITAIMFVVISNPYNVGDRVRIDGQVMYVRRITTYNTEFRSSHGKHIIYQNILLSKMLIINESRAKHATLELNLKMSSSTTPASLKMLRDNVKTFVNGRPRDFVHNSIYFHCNKLQVSHYLNLVIWATCVESWSNTRAVFGLRTALMSFVAKQCKLLGIGYENAASPVYFKNSLNLGGLEPIIDNFVNGDGHHHNKPNKKDGQHHHSQKESKQEKGQDTDKPRLFKKWDNLLGKGENVPKKGDGTVEKPNENVENRGEESKEGEQGNVERKSVDKTSIIDPEVLEKEKRAEKSSFEIISKLGTNQHSPALAHLFWGDPPRPSSIARVTGTLTQQPSIGPLNIEPTFPGLSKSSNKSSGSGAPKPPPPETLQHVNKNIVVHPHFPHVRKSANLDSYENVWLNTWSPDNRPHRFKDSFESTYESIVRKSVEQLESELKETEREPESSKPQRAQEPPEQQHKLVLKENYEKINQPIREHGDKSDRKVTIVRDIFESSSKPKKPAQALDGEAPVQRKSKSHKQGEKGSGTKPKRRKATLEPKHMRIQKHRETAKPPPPCP